MKVRRPLLVGLTASLLTVACAPGIDLNELMTESGALALIEEILVGDPARADALRSPSRCRGRRPPG